MTQEFFFGLSVFEEKVAKPYLGEVGLILVSGIYFLDCVESLGFEIEALPDFGKATPA